VEFFFFYSFTEDAKETESSTLKENSKGRSHQ